MTAPGQRHASWGACCDGRFPVFGISEQALHEGDVEFTTSKLSQVHLVITLTMDLKHISRGITDGRDRAGARSMFKAIGFTDADLSRPLIGVANTWIETMPCNFHLRRLSAKVKEGIRAAGGTPMEFNTIAISDGETMGTEGMRASLVSRELIADSIELVCRGQMFDAVVCVVGCDKTIPAAAMALARMNLPGMVLYGGTIAPGNYRGKDVTIQDVYEAIGANVAGKMSDADLRELEDAACPGAGACGGQYTANTMSTVMEMIGLSPMGFNSVPAMDPQKDEISFDCGKVVMNVLQSGTQAARHSDARGFRECDCVGRGDWRIDQCGSAPAGDCARGGRRTGD